MYSNNNNGINLVKKKVFISWLFNRLTLSVPNEAYYRNASGVRDKAMP